MIYITADPHGDFTHIKSFCESNNTVTDDILIILGDAGINYYGGSRDKKLKLFIKSLPITIFCIHGNHENRATNISSYKSIEFHGGIVYMQNDYPNILFAKDGEIFDFNGKSTIVIGGAYSVDKWHRIANKWSWFADEQPSEEIKKYVECQLDNIGWKIDYVLSHTCPMRYEPKEWFLDFINQSTVDKSTEIWLDSIEDRLNYEKWNIGHYHGSKIVDKIKFIWNKVEEFK